MAYASSTTTAWRANNDTSIPWNTTGAKVLSASGQVTASTEGAGVFVGRGLFMLELTVSTILLGSGFDTINFMVQRNTSRLPGQWTNIGQLCIGDATGIGVALGIDVYTFPIWNDGDSEVRIYTYVNGSASAVTWAAKLYPMRSKESA